MAKSSVDTAIDYLQESKGSWPEICRVTKLQYSWLSKLAQGRIQNPGTRKIEKLLEYSRRPRKERAA